MAAKPISLKLLVDTESWKVLFAEGGKDFIDFLFSFLILPLGSVTEILGKQSMVGALGKLYNSMENMDETYIAPGQDKSTLLEPEVNLPVSKPLFSPIGKPPAVQRKYYTCSNNDRTYNMPCKLVTDVADTRCAHCQSTMSMELNFAAAARNVEGERGGFVKGVVTYMVMDDLVISPMSAISAITLLRGFNIKEVEALEEMVVEVGMDEGVSLLKSSLQSKTVLTDVFLGKIKKQNDAALEEPTTKDGAEESPICISI